VKVFLAQTTKVDHLPPASPKAFCSVSSSDDDADVDRALGDGQNVDTSVVNQSRESTPSASFLIGRLLRSRWSSAELAQFTL
jgi:hypothetical protein